MDNPVFILGSHKSGTSLLRNLLDGSDSFFVIPLELHFFEYSGLWVNYKIRRSLPVELDFDQVLRRIETVIQKSNQKSSLDRNFGGDSLVEAGKWDIERLRSHLDQNGRKAFEQRDFRLFFDAYVEAIYLALHRELPTGSTRFVEKSVENAEYASLLKKIYPDAKFIHIVRNPYAALVSIRKFKPYKGHYPFLGTFLEAMENSYYYSFYNPMVIENYLVIRYEDLLIESEKTMRKIAGFLDTPFTSSMLNPSTLGVDWKGNSMSGKEFQGISNYPLNAWKSDINPLEIDLVNTLLPHVFSKFDYKIIRPPLSPNIPLKGETAKVYLANRFYRFLVKVRRTGE